MAPTDLSDAERGLWSAFPAGAWVDLRAGDEARDDPGSAHCWGPERTIRAEVIRALLLGAAPTEPGRFPAVRLRGARVVGQLDVMGAAVGCALVCEHCHFDTAPRFVEAVTRTVRIVASRLAGFNGARMRVEGILNFHRSVVDGVLRLDRATVNGEVLLRESALGAAHPTEALAASGLTVDGDLDCRELVAHGPVVLANARVTGSVHLADAKVAWHGSPAVHAANAVIGGGFDGERMTVLGETRLRHCRIAGSLQLVGAELRNPGGAALSGGGLSVEGGVWCNRLAATGEVRLIGARLAANLALHGASLSNPGGTALNLDHATLADLDAPDLSVTAGTLSLFGTQVASRLNLAGARLDPGEAGDDAVALNADGAVVGARLILTRADIRGQVSLRTGRIGGRVLLQEARIDNPGGTALRLSRSEVAADVFCDGATIIGRFRLTGAQIGGELNLRRARLVNPGGPALDGKGLQAAEVSLRPADPIQGSVNLAHTRIGVLRDDPQRWPDELRLDGSSYEALEPQLPAQQRLAWLARYPGQSQQAYEHLAALYAKIGQPAEARRVLHASQRRQRSAKTLPGRVWDLLQDITVGYGYRPSRAAVWLAALLAVGSITYAWRPPAPLNGSGAPHFNPVIYTLDLLLPVVDLGQKHAFNPAGLEQWFSYLLVAAGWVLATTIAAGVARVISRG